MSENINLLIVDDQSLIRDGIASLLSLQENIVIAGTASNGKEAVEKADRLRPDVILMDIRMPVMDGITAAEKNHKNRILQPYNNAYNI